MGNANEDAMAKETEEAIQKLNPLTWPSNPRYAKFYVIKSFGEDDVHKSIKYNLWCSTERGNRKLDEAFFESKRVNAANIANDNGMKKKRKNDEEDTKEAEEEEEEVIDSRDSKRGCPVYMFFSVNRSGCFCGMAQMISSYYKERHFGSWVQDGKWQGSFIVKWIYVKDIPNKDLKDIQLPNNDNRPVTFSRDTQEIPFNQGVEMLRRFIKYEPKTNILQDFKYYDDRERDIKQKRTQQIILQRMGNQTPQQQTNDEQQQRLIDNDQYSHNQNGYGRGRGRGRYGAQRNGHYGYRGRGGHSQQYHHQNQQQSNGHHFGQNNRRNNRYFKNNERNSYHHSNGNSYRHQAQQQQQQQSYGNYQILKRNDGDTDRPRYNNRAKNRWVPK